MNSNLTNKKRKYCIPSTEFEIHFAAEQGRYPPSLKKSLLESEFTEDGLEGDGVVFSPNDPCGKLSCPLTGLHMSWSSFERASYIKQKKLLDNIVNRYETRTTGYIHCEVIKPEWDISLEYKPHNSSVDFPVRRFYSEVCDVPKVWDIHISADLKTLNKRLQQCLFDESNMYFIDLKKRTGRIHRVFTIQGKTSLKSGYDLFVKILEYLESAGGMKGAIKFEETIYWRKLGSPEIIPPLITSI